MEKQTMGSFIAALRKASGMTQREMAEKLNVSDKAVSRWERDESAPDLMLIPVIADLFDITADELLRGRRMSSAEGNGVANERKQERERELSEKSVRTLAKRKLEKLRWISLIAAGIGTAGLVVALICDSVFFASKLGFFLSLLFYISAVITEIIGLTSFFSSMEAIATALYHSATEERVREMTAPYRAEGFQWSCAVFTILGGFIGMVFPLVQAQVYQGGYIALLGMPLLLATAATGAGLVFFICRLVIRRLLTKKDILPMPSAVTEWDRLRRKMVKRYLLIWGALMLLTAIGAGIFNNISISTYAQAKVFHDYDSFVEYMEEGQYREQGFDEGYIAEIKKDMENDPAYEILTDSNNKELCRYRRSIYDCVVQIEYSFHKSVDGLPVYVYTARAMEAALNVQDNVNTLLILFAALETLLCGVLYYRKCKKLR